MKNELKSYNVRCNNLFMQKFFGYLEGKKIPLITLIQVLSANGRFFHYEDNGKTNRRPFAVIFIIILSAFTILALLFVVWSINDHVHSILTNLKVGSSFFVAIMSVFFCFYNYAFFLLKERVLISLPEFRFQKISTPPPRE